MSGIKISLLAASALAAAALTNMPEHSLAQAQQQQPSIGDRLGKVIGQVTGNPMAKSDSDMMRVIDTMQELGVKPIALLPPQDARLQPTSADAVKTILRKDGKSAEPPPTVTTRGISIPGPGGALPSRVYMPQGAGQGGALPVVVYYHGGGWVIADIETYDASARAMAEQANVIVVSADYRRGPEHKFPAAHEDAFAAYQWIAQNAQQFGGDPNRLAVMGESAGGNLAINTAIMARDRDMQRPVHQVLVYPVAGVNTNMPSYQENEASMPLNKAGMEWFFRHYANGPQDMQDPRLDVASMDCVSQATAAQVLIAAYTGPAESGLRR